MAGSKWKRERHELVYPKHALMPEDFLTFIEMSGFNDEWVALGLTDDDLGMFQAIMMAAPTSNAPLPGSGGFRVLEMSRTGDVPITIQVGYVYFDDYGIVLLVMARSDKVMTRLSAKGKQSIARLIERESRAFSKGTFR